MHQVACDNICICMMKFLSTALIFAIAISESAVAGFPYAYPAFSYMSALPYVHPVAAPLLHAAPAYYPHMAYHPNHELQNVAGAVQKESSLRTDVAMRFPLKAN